MSRGSSLISRWSLPATGHTAVFFGRQAGGFPPGGRTQEYGVEEWGGGGGGDCCGDSPVGSLLWCDEGATEGESSVQTSDDGDVQLGRRFGEGAWQEWAGLSGVRLRDGRGEEEEEVWL